MATALPAPSGPLPPEIARPPFDMEMDELILRRLASSQLNADIVQEYLGQKLREQEFSADAADVGKQEFWQWLNRLDAARCGTNDPLVIGDWLALTDKDTVEILAGWAKLKEVTRQNKKERLLAALLVDKIHRDLIGVALSGGGVRSASFNLGVLQALSEKDDDAQNVLGRVDYLSTVSGGGYIGSFYTNLLHNLSRNPARQTDDAQAILAPKNGQQSKEVQQLIRGGQYLNHPERFLNRFLIGWFWINLVFWSGYLGICLALAWGWRWLDVAPVHTYILWASYGNCLDYIRPFLPAAVFFTGWLVCWAALYWNWFMLMRPILRGTVDLAVVGILVVVALQTDGGIFFRLDGWFLVGVWSSVAVLSFLVLNLPRFRDFLYKASLWLFVLACVALLIGGAVWLSTPVMNTRSGADSAHTDLADYWTRQSHLLGPLLVILAICLLPFLSPGKLLHSGEKGKGSWEGIVFKIATYALLGGIPLASVMWTARHNVSGYADNPSREMVNSDIKDWPRFWRSDIGIHLRKRMEKDQIKDAQDAVTELNDQMQKSVRDPVREKELEKNVLHHLQLLQLILDLGDKDTLNRLEKRFDQQKVTWLEWNEIETMREQITQRLNRTLKNRDVFAGSKVAIEGAKAAALEPGEQAQLSDYLILNSRNLLDDHQWRALAYLLLRSHYPEELWPSAMARRSVAIERDQAWRLHLMAWVFGVFALSALFVNVNATSLHWFYYEQLREAYLKMHPCDHSRVKLKDLDNVSKGGPYHLLNATVDLGPQEHSNLFASALFLFSKRYCGCQQLGYEATKTYQDGDVELPTALAVSGAAVTPLRVRNPLVALLMTLMNLRLGQWFVRPNGRSGFVNNTHFLGLAIDRLRGWFNTTGQRLFYFLSDGGHEENLGIEPLLDRRCRLIIASDAGQDQNHEFDDLSKLYRRMRLRGIRFLDPRTREPVSLEVLRPKGDPKRTLGACIQVTIVYPDGVEGTLIYLKPCFTHHRTEELDLINFRTHNSLFPHDPTSDVLFDPNQVESYRQLGEMIGRTLLPSVGQLLHPAESAPTEPAPAPPTPSYVATDAEAVETAATLNGEK